MIETIMDHPVDKNAISEQMVPLRRLFTKSVVVSADLPAGTLLEEHHLAAKKPGTGIPAERMPEVIGKILRRAVLADTLLTDDDLE
jgi:N-acetylneuraminate synthase